MRGFLCAATVLLCALGTAHATVLNYVFPLDGLQEVPPVVTPATGIGNVTLDTDTLQLSWNIQYGGLIGTVTASHFHGAAAPGVNAGIRVNIGGNGLASPIVGSTTISAAFAQELQNGLWYVNVHSSFAPGGEIRGQVVPEPGSLALLAVAGLGLIRRR